MIVGAKQPFTDRAKYVVDQFPMRGKSVGVFVDGQVLQTPRGMMMPGMDMPQIAQNNEANLDDLLSVYGVKIKQDIVLDMQNYIGPVQVGGQMLGVNHPVFLVAGPLPQVHQINTGSTRPPSSRMPARWSLSAKPRTARATSPSPSSPRPAKSRGVRRDRSCSCQRSAPAT